MRTKKLTLAGLWAAILTALAAVPAYADLISEGLKVPYSFAPQQLSRQRAGSVAVLGMRLFEHGFTVDAADHAPTYLRVSQAEREKG